MSWYLSGVQYFAYGYISVLFIRIHPSGLCTPTTHSFVFAFVMPMEQQQRSSVSTVTVNDDSGADISPSIKELIQSFVAESIDALADNLSQIIDDRLFGFARWFLEEMIPLSSKPLKGRVEKVTPVRERETNGSWTMPFKCWIGWTKHPSL